MTTRKRRTFGEQLIASAEEAVRIRRGELEPGSITRYTANTAEVGAPPQYGPDRIRGIRNSMEMSQALFAAALNVSPETIRAWEQGKRTPDGATLRLLELAEDHAEVFLDKVRVRAGQAVSDD